MQSGGDAASVGVRECVGERIEERIAAGTVAGSHAAQVAVEFASGQEVGEGVLLDARSAPVGKQLLALDRLQESGRDNEPADPERRRERLARRARVDDAIEDKALERADGRAVVAVLGVVVVLDRDRAGLAQPGQQRGPPFALEHNAGGMLVGRSQHDRVGVGALEFVDPCSAFMNQIGTGSRRALSAITASSGLLGTSSAIRLAPPAASARHTKPRPCV